jgi:fructose-1,6-bisphosphatase II
MVAVLATITRPIGQIHPRAVFTDTGISSGPLLDAVEVNGSIATTPSVIMRARNGTVRFIKAHHDLNRKTVHLRSTQAERRV